MATERFSIGVDVSEDGTTATFGRFREGELTVLNRWSSMDPEQRWVIRAPYDGYYSINGGESLFAHEGDVLFADPLTQKIDQSVKPWWRKIIWRSVLIYTLALLIATTLALAFDEPWYATLLWYALYLPLACSLSRSYL